MRPASTVLFIPPLRQTQNTSDVICEGRTYTGWCRNASRTRNLRQGKAFTTSAILSKTVAGKCGMGRGFENVKKWRIEKLLYKIRAFYP